MHESWMCRTIIYNQDEETSPMRFLLLFSVDKKLSDK
jgi:hypothetical protein